MDLLDRYLEVVRFFLPAKDQDDIIRELRENLVSQIEDREEELGRALDDEELAAILRRHGHPILVAGRYRSHRQLIGPVFFPIYLFVLKAGLGVAAIVTIVLAVVNAAMHGTLQSAIKAVSAYPGRALMVFAWTTLGFALLDMMQARVRVVTNWDPRRLPKLKRHESSIPRSRTLCEYIFAAIGVIWLLVLSRSPFLLVGPAASLVEYAPIWRAVYPPIVLIAVANAALHLVTFLRPYFTKRRSYARLAVDSSWLLVLAILIRAGQYFVPVASVQNLPENVNANQVVDILNMTFQIGFSVAAVIVFIQIVKELHRLKRATPMPPDSMAAPAAR